MKFLLFLCLIAIAFTAVIEAEVFAELDLKSNKADVMIDFVERFDYAKYKPAYSKMDGIQKGRFIVSALRSIADKSQVSVRKVLKENNVEFTNLWIKNTISAKGLNEKLISQISRITEVDRIWLDKSTPATFETPSEEPVKSNNNKAESNVAWVKAPEAWAKGHTGKNAVLGICDSGTVHSHPALVSSYRGNENGNFKHDFNWFDPVEKSRTPVDGHSHGTHVTGKC